MKYYIMIASAMLMGCKQEPAPTIKPELALESDSVNSLLELSPKENFDRIPTTTIDKALNTVPLGEIAVSDTIGMNECIGEPILDVRYADDIRRIGHLYHIYASEWIFKAKPSSLMGLAFGDAKSMILEKLGKPHRTHGDTTVYLSEKPDGYESEYFDARWEVHLIFKSGYLEALRFVPFSDDC